jgi:hypothetical protein
MACITDIPTNELVEYAQELRDARALIEKWRFVSALIGAGEFKRFASDWRTQHREERYYASRNWWSKPEGLRALAPTHADAPGAYEAVLAELERRGAERANPCQT